MKIVIDIPKDAYKEIIESDIRILPLHTIYELENALLKGKPLPKGHGRLIDADALRKSFQESIDECHKWAENVKDGEMYARVSQALGTFVECSLRTKNAPTIIEADMEAEHDET